MMEYTKTNKPYVNQTECENQFQKVILQLPEVCGHTVPTFTFIIVSNASFSLIFNCFKVEKRILSLLAQH